MSYGKIRVGSSKHQKSKFNLGSTISTTSGFCDIQPLGCTELIPDTHITVDSGQMILANAMPLSTFGRVNMMIYHRFVSLPELWHPYEFLLKGQEYGTSSPYIPTKTPYFTLGKLTLWTILSYSGVAFYKDNQDDNYILVDSASEYNTLLTSFKSIYARGMGDYMTFGRLVGPTTDEGKNNFPLISRADFILKFNGNLAAVHLNEQGLRLRKALLGLGYKMNVDSIQPVSALPLFAYYRAYWDEFLRIYNYTWEKTYAHKLLYAFENQNITNLDNNCLTQGAAQNYMFIQFMNDITNMFYTYPQDFVGSHISTPAITPAYSVTTTSPSALQYSNLSLGNNANNQPTLGSGSVPFGGAFTQARFDLLKRLTTIVNKNTIFGGNLRGWLKSVYGADYQMADDSNLIGRHILTCDFESIMSTADTATDDSGTLLGARGGQGSANNNSGKFDFTTNSFGYVISFMTVCPDGQWCQGLNGALLHIDQDTIYRPEYDGLGYEITTKSQIYGDKYVSNGTVDTSVPSFGYISRGSSYKYSMNNINGDISRLGFRDSMLGYNLDPVINPYDLTIENTDDTYGHYKVTFEENDIPIADPAWRFRGRYPWMSNFNRIFYNGALISLGKDFGKPSHHVLGDDYDEYSVIDNFNINIRVNIHANSPMLSNGESYDTDAFSSYNMEVEKA